MRFKTFDYLLKSRGYISSREYAYDSCSCNGCQGCETCMECDCYDETECDYDYLGGGSCWAYGVEGKCVGCFSPVRNCRECAQNKEFGCTDDIDYHLDTEDDYNEQGEQAYNWLYLSKNVYETWDDAFFYDDYNKQIRIATIQHIEFEHLCLIFKLFNGKEYRVYGGYGDDEG